MVYQFIKLSDLIYDIHDEQGHICRCWYILGLYICVFIKTGFNVKTYSSSLNVKTQTRPQFYLFQLSRKFTRFFIFWFCSLPRLQLIVYVLQPSINVCQSLNGMKPPVNTHLILGDFNATFLSMQYAWYAISMQAYSGLEFLNIRSSNLSKILSQSQCSDQTYGKSNILKLSLFFGNSGSALSGGETPKFMDNRQYSTVVLLLKDT